MNEKHMKELMIHVERIVRPVRAKQSRKLAIRRELRSHLRAALDEELARTPGNEAAALEAAKSRLGDPAELTCELQHSVPLIQRILLARSPERFNRWERGVAKSLGLFEAATLGHWLLLYGAGALAFVIVWIFSPHVSPEARTAFLAWGIANHGAYTAIVMSALVLELLWCYAGLRFLNTIALPRARFSPIRALVEGVIMVCLQAILMMFIVANILWHAATLGQIAESLLCSVVLMIVVAFIGRWVAGLRRPYDEWLTLDIDS